MRRTSFFVLVVLVATLAAGAYFGWQAWNQFVLAAELRNALVLTSEEGGGGNLYQWDGKGFSLYSSANARIEDVARDGVNLAKIVRAPGDTAFSVVVNNKVVYSSQTPKRGISLAPGSQKVAFAERYRMATTTGETDTIENWQSVVIDLSTAASTTFPGSFSPYFQTEQRFVRFVPNGLVAYDLHMPQRGDMLYATGMVFTDPATPTSLAPGHKDVMWIDPESGGPFIFWFPERDSGTSTPIRQTYFTVGPYTTSVISDTSYYEIRHREGGSELWARTYEHPNPQFVHKFPADLRIKTIIF